MIRKAALGLVFAAAATVPASADPATLLGVFQNWSAYSAGSGSELTCYALTPPRASQPRGAKRAPIYLMVSDWPGRKVKAEPQIVLGYDVKPDARPARNLFAVSILYLFALFASLLAEHLFAIAPLRAVL